MFFFLKMLPLAAPGFGSDHCSFTVPRESSKYAFAKYLLYNEAIFTTPEDFFDLRSNFGQGHEVFRSNFKVDLSAEITTLMSSTYVVSMISFSSDLWSNFVNSFNRWSFFPFSTIWCADAI